MATIEQNMSKWSISGLGVSVTTMEEVFLRVGEIAEQELHKEDDEEEEGACEMNVSMHKYNITDTTVVDPIEFSVPQPLAGTPLLFQHLSAMLHKRFAYIKRAWWSLAIVMLIPLLMLSLALSSNYSFGERVSFVSLIVRFSQASVTTRRQQSCH